MEQERLYLLAKEIFEHEQLLAEEERVITRYIMNKNEYSPKDDYVEDIDTAIRRTMLPETEPLNSDLEGWEDNLEIKVEPDDIRFQIIADDYCKRKSIKPVKVIGRLFENKSSVVFNQKTGKIVYNALADISPELTFLSFFIAMELHRVHSLIPEFFNDYDNLPQTDRFLVANTVLDLLLHKNKNISSEDARYQKLNNITFLHNSIVASNSMSEYLKERQFLGNEELKENLLLFAVSLTKDMQEKCYHSLLNVTEKRNALYNLCVENGKGFENDSMYGILSDVLDENCAPFLANHNFYSGAKTLDNLIDKMERQCEMTADRDHKTGAMSINYIIPASCDVSNFQEE